MTAGEVFEHPPVRVDDVVATGLRLLSVESPQHNLDQVRACIQDVVQPLVIDAGFDDVRIDEDGNLLALRAGQRDLPPVLIYTYAATYPAEGMPDPYPARELDLTGVGRVLRGRGAAEQRSGLAAAIVGLGSYLRQAEAVQRGLLLVTCIAGEMGNHDVVSRVCDRGLRASAGVLAVATETTLCLGNRGRVDVHVAVHGRSSHSSNPSAGLNAIEGALEFLKRVADLPLPPADTDLGAATLVPIHIESWPRAPHTIPDLVRITLDRRLLPEEEPEHVVRALADAGAAIGRFAIQVEPGYLSYPNRIEPGAPVAGMMGQAMEAAGLRLTTSYRKSALDAGYLTRLGIPSVMFGPGQPHLAHTDEEYVAVDDLYRSALTFYHLARIATEA